MHRRRFVFALIGLALTLPAAQQSISLKKTKAMSTAVSPPASTTSTAQRDHNRQVVDNFFVALETERFELLREVFAPEGRQLNPYVPEGFPKSFDGAEAIYQQYSGLPKQFSRMRFPRTIHATDDPNFFFVQWRGEIDIRGGGRYENDYVGTFRLRDGRVVEYTEYFNPIVMAKAFNIPLK